MEKEQEVKLVLGSEFGLNLPGFDTATEDAETESNTPEISEEDLQDVARSLVSSFASLLPRKTFECRDAETSVVLSEMRNVGTGMSQVQGELSPSRRSSLTSLRAELKDAQTETENEITKNTSTMSTVQFQKPEVHTFSFQPSVVPQNSNQENIPPPNQSQTLTPLMLVGGDNPAADFFFNKELSLEEIDLVKQSRKHASFDRVVPNSKKYMKVETIYQKGNVPVTSPATSVVRRQSNFQYYDYPCIDGLEEPYKTQCPEKAHAEIENTAVVPDVYPTPCPQLRLGLSRRSRPRKPLHEYVFMDQ